MSVSNGKDGSVNVASAAVADVFQWELSEDPQLEEYASSSTSNWTKTVEGNHRWSGSFQVAMNLGVAPTNLVAGSLVALILYTSASNFYSGNARLGEVSGPQVNIRNPAILFQTWNFVGDGTLTRPT